MVLYQMCFVFFFQCKLASTISKLKGILKLTLNRSGQAESVFRRRVRTGRGLGACRYPILLDVCYLLCWTACLGVPCHLSDVSSAPLPLRWVHHVRWTHFTSHYSKLLWLGTVSDTLVLIVLSGVPHACASLPPKHMLSSWLHDSSLASRRGQSVRHSSRSPVSGTRRVSIRSGLGKKSHATLP